ncbi:Imm50 family immunity protein [Kitasatospora sp. NPDC054939]
MTAPDAPAGGDWTGLLADPAEVRAVLGTPAPPLTDFELFAVHFDERERSATLGFTARTVPAGAAGVWRERGHNAVEFFLVLTGLHDVAVDGWSHEPSDAITLTGGTALVAGPRHRIAFGHRGVRAERLRGYRAGSP